MILSKKMIQRLESTILLFGEVAQLVRAQDS